MRFRSLAENEGGSLTKLLLSFRWKTLEGERKVEYVRRAVTGSDRDRIGSGQPGNVVFTRSISDRHAPIKSNPPI